MESNLKSEIINQQSMIGYVVGGGLKENLRVRLVIPAQQVQEGGFVVIESGDWQFYGLVIDLQLGATDPRFADEQSESRLPPELAQQLHGQTGVVSGYYVKQTGQVYHLGAGARYVLHAPRTGFVKAYSLRVDARYYLRNGGFSFDGSDAKTLTMGGGLVLSF